MQNTIYATYASPERADLVFVQLLECGASLLDIVVITAKTYQGRFSEPKEREVTVMEIAESGDIAFDVDQTARESADAAKTQPGLDMLALDPTQYAKQAYGWDPFEQTEDGICLLDQLSIPGDLASCLRNLGFSDLTAHQMETLVLNGGALLILRVPSGPVTDLQGMALVQQGDGDLRSPTESNPYMM